ncbi:DUF418 domain-containing protein [Glycomyces rhizosphaerae]|uniref:DUF418 domain-containing protein n=1 Tax=Glycomyces rhizosphaerae TaxID=2054422 RepID=A0ABV7Q2M7_9ACTN
MSHPNAGLLAPPESVAPRGRSLAPDLARGFMLLAIALAHIPGFIADWDRGPSGLNAAADTARVLLFDNQARIMFIFLFGYGLGQLALSRAAQGSDWTDIRKLMRRRAFWLLVIGFLNMVVLVPLDFISAYGVTLLLFAGLVRARGKTLLWTGFTVLAAAIALSMWTEIEQLKQIAAGSQPGAGIDFIKDDFGAHLLLGLTVFPSKALGSVVMIVPAMVFGLWAARRRVLDEPERHRGLLRGVALGFLGFALVARIPYTLMQTGVLDADTGTIGWLATAGHSLGGYAGGIGAAALVGLIAIRLARRGPFTTAVAALGQRSMTFYIFQSAMFLVLYYPFMLDLGGTMGLAGSFAVGIGIWVVSLALAEWMRRAGHRGPFETLLRRLAERR